MEQQPAWQRHILLIIGISLPFALMIFIIGYRSIVTSAVDLPLYAAVYAVIDPDNTYPAGTFESNITNESLNIQYIPPSGVVNETRTATPRIRAYILRDPIKGPETFDVLGDISMKEKTSLPLPQPLQIPMIDGATAPDEYAYSYNYDGYNGLFTDIFVGGARNTRDLHRIFKNGRSFPLLPDNLRWANFRFLGWVKEPLRP